MMVTSVAFGRLCVETFGNHLNQPNSAQSPSGGCVLKHPNAGKAFLGTHQSPSGGCVLKHTPRYCATIWALSRLRAAVC